MCQPMCIYFHILYLAKNTFYGIKIILIECQGRIIFQVLFGFPYWSTTNGGFCFLSSRIMLHIFLWRRIPSLDDRRIYLLNVTWTSASLEEWNYLFAYLLLWSLRPIPILFSHWVMISDQFIPCQRSYCSIEFFKLFCFVFI